MVRRRERWPYLLFMIVVTRFQIPNSTELFRCTLSCSTFSRDAASCACAGQFPATTWSTRPCGGGWRVSVGWWWWWWWGCGGASAFLPPPPAAHHTVVRCELCAAVPPLYRHSSALRQVLWLAPCTQTHAALACSTPAHLATEGELNRQVGLEGKSRRRGSQRRRSVVFSPVLFISCRADRQTNRAACVHVSDYF